ncbi:DUF6518 family protein [Paenibacillus aurantiacus]|uniref:DUF6518 family protein n=1 Tax=Paenibacillus aurantiacus TaxID=1936118 RepID=A0ABV5KI58_9BACL
MLLGKLNTVRSKSEHTLTIQQKLRNLLLVILAGAVLGFLAKYTDGSPIGNIGSKFGVWIFATAIIAIWSRSPYAAASHVFAFLVAMLTVYYYYSTVLFGFFPRHYAIAWGTIALASPIGGYMVWFARGNGWVAALCAALPISLMLTEGVVFDYSLSPGARYIYFHISDWFNVVSSGLLIMSVTRAKNQLLRILVITIAMYFLLEKIGIYYYISI